MFDVQAPEEILSLPDNRQIAFSQAGNASSKTVFLFFVGLFSVGSITSIPAPIRHLDAHLIHPTLPGNGLSSSEAPGVSYSISLCRDIKALLENLHPEDSASSIEVLYIGGGSFGSVAAQILYGSPYSWFPFGKRIKGCLLLAPFSPFKLDRNYSKGMTWLVWLSIGAPARLVPFHLISRMLAIFFSLHLKNLDDAVNFFGSFMLGNMDEIEIATFEQFCQQNGTTRYRFLQHLAQDAIHCSSNNWHGFLQAPRILNSDWGFDPRCLDQEHSEKKMLVVRSDQDDLGPEMSEWLVDAYPNAQMTTVRGGHMAGLYSIDKLWAHLLAES